MSRIGHFFKFTSFFRQPNNIPKLNNESKNNEPNSENSAMSERLDTTTTIFPKLSNLELDGSISESSTEKFDTHIKLLNEILEICDSSINDASSKSDWDSLKETLNQLILNIPTPSYTDKEQIKSVKDILTKINSFIKKHKLVTKTDKDLLNVLNDRTEVTSVSHRPLHSSEDADTNLYYYLTEQSPKLAEKIQQKYKNFKNSDQYFIKSLENAVKILKDLHRMTHLGPEGKSMLRTTYYPDSTYLSRFKEDLAAKKADKSFTSKLNDILIFCENIERYVGEDEHIKSTLKLITSDFQDLQDVLKSTFKILQNETTFQPKIHSTYNHLMSTKITEINY